MGFSTFAEAPQKFIPFCPGEKLVFEVSWQFISAGTVVLEVLPIEEINGKKVYHFVMNVKTSSFVDHFYKVRDRIESFSDIGMNHAVMYKKQKMGGRKKDVLVTFDWEKNEVQYSNFGKKRLPVPLIPGTFDPLSVFYAFRFFDLEADKEFQVPATDGKKCIMGKAKVIRREKIKTENNTFDTYFVEPDLEHIGGVFEKSKDATIKLWVTADKRRIPVRLKSKVVVGSFIAELISIEGVNGHGSAATADAPSQAP